MMTGFEQYTRKTRRAIFLEEMEQVVPWRELCALIEPHTHRRRRTATHRRYRYKDRIDEVERAKNRTKLRVRSKVEHVFAVMKLKFGLVKLRYRGLKKNGNQLFAVCALVNLYLLRKKLLRLAPA
jgi:transposase, IS5 family